jgi:C4-dicarboxylate-specific signal transduction histidine kinase
MNGNARILIADDDITGRTMLVGVLKRWGYDVDSCSNGTDAYNRLMIEDYPLAILDWMMDGMDGVDICRRLTLNRKNQMCYLILLTGRKEMDDVIRGLEAGANDYVVKPFDPDELNARIRVGMRVAQLQRDLKKYSEEMETLAEQRAQQLVHSDRLSTLGTLTSGIAHEVNNPLSFISGNLRFIKDCWPSIVMCIKEAGAQGLVDGDMAETMLSEIPKSLQGIKTGIERITHIVEGLKFYARKGGGEKKTVDIVTAVEKSLEFCNNRLKYGIEVDFEKVPDARVKGDMQQLQQVFVNLLVNSADALEKTENPKITIRIAEEGGEAVITFRDNGPGFTGSGAIQVFNPFFTTKEVGKGTGLGLSICQGIIENHGGEITAENGETGGACITITLPRMT